MAKANPFRFSTKYQDDETDLLYYGYRYYNASTGRWLSRDPLEEAGGANVYEFIANDPVGSYDLLGRLRNYNYYSLAEMDAMLSRSKEVFRKKLYALCPHAGQTMSCAGDQVCTAEACHLQADMLTFDFASYLKAAFIFQYNRFGNIAAFSHWNPFGETINTRADKAPHQGMIWVDFSAGYGLKCYGMQDLMTRRFQAVMTPMKSAGMQCFKGAKVGNNRDYRKASHHWFGIYSITNDDITRVDVDVDPLFSAGGIISPDRRGFGEAAYFDPILW